MKKVKSPKNEKIVKLKSVQGKVAIDPKNKEQLKWFEEFKKSTNTRLED